MEQKSIYPIQAFLKVNTETGNNLRNVEQQSTEPIQAFQEPNTNTDEVEGTIAMYQKSIEGESMVNGVELMSMEVESMVKREQESISLIDAFSLYFLNKVKRLDGSLPFLPYELVFYEIFSRLPVKSLHRFRCVSTSFHRLTSDQRFITAIRRYGARRQLISFSCALPTKIVLYSTDGHVGPYTPASLLARVIDNPSITHCTSVSVINGFICQVNEYSDVYVMNNATTEKIKLPTYQPPTEWDRKYFYFCHDPDTNTYKVLCTVAAGFYKAGTQITMNCSIFTLGLDTWRGLNHPDLIQFGNSRNICIDGFLYLDKFRDIDGRDVICVFDVQSESFSVMLYPNGVFLSSDDFTFIEINSTLALIDIDILKMEDIILWTMKKDSMLDDGGSWLHRNIEFPSEWKFPHRLCGRYHFSVNGDGEIVMATTSMMSINHVWVSFYNMEKKTWRSMKISGIVNSALYGNFRVDEYVENPLSLS